VTHDPYSSDATLLGLAAGGDRAAFGVLYERHVRPVYWQAYAVLHDDGGAEDVTQDTFITLWRKRDGVRVIDSSVLPWLLRTAKMSALNLYRRELRRSGAQLTQADEARSADPTDSVESIVDAAVVRGEIDKAVARLSALDRQVFELCVEGELSYEQAGRALGITHAAVRNRLSRLRAALRSDLRAMKEMS
jgi:RNA polymerase sigma factor (sigma-70 family)